MTQKINTFWDLITLHRIEIPIIQRDYAQGRANNETNDIRIGFVKELHKAISEKKELLHLNFVYGKVKGVQNAQQLIRNKEAVHNMLNAVKSYSQTLDLNIDFKLLEQQRNDDGTHYTAFVPLDGQQRLTTLYLLHWYLLKRLGKTNELEQLKNFSYKIRPSSKDFCEALIKNSISITDDKLSEEIKDANWYFSHWSKDPTVSGMLTMLDAIHSVFNHQDSLETYWKNLKNGRVQFEFLDLDNFNLTDELYIKMNARGKHLTPFENFKAWLMEYISERKIDLEIKDWKRYFDTKWADLFWNNKGEDEFVIDQAYMNFFRNMFQIFYVQGNDYDSKKASELAKSVEKTSFLSNQFYKDLEILNSNNLNKIFKIIQALINNDRAISKIDKIVSEENEVVNFFNDISIFKSFVSSKVTYADKARFYALYQYLLLKNNTAKFTLLSWMRVCRNLITNSDINSIEKLVSAMKGIDELIKNDTLYTSLIGLEKLTGFNEKQIKEEAKKARLINSEIIKESNFLKFENHSYFRGQVNFLLELSNEDLVKFIEYGNKCDLIFEKKLENFLLERAFLAKHDYLDNRGRNKSFLNFKEWKNLVFQTKRLDLFKDVLDDIELGNEIKEELQKIINSYEKSDWRGLLIEYSAAMRFCEDNRIRIYHKAHEVRLLKGTVLGGSRGQNRELHSYCFYLKIKRKYKNTNHLLRHIWYNTISGTPNDAVPCAVLDSYKETYDYAVDIYFVEGKYNMRFFNRVKNQDIESNIVQQLKQLDFIHKKENLCCYKEEIKTMDEIEKCLLEICNKIKPFQIPRL